jgi:hypothetical protein
MVGGLSGTCPTIRFTVEGRVVRTDGATRFQHGPCTSIVERTRVEVRGEEQADGSVLAERVDIDERDDDDD